MGLSRKRQREFNRLKHETEELLRDQREVLENASHVVRSAGRQAGNYAREEIAPRMHDTYEDKVRPAVRSGVAATRSVAHAGKEKVSDDIIPALTAALGAAIAAIESAKNSKLADSVVDASKTATKNAKKLGVKAGIIEPPKSSSGPAKYIFLGVAIVAAAGVAYAAWQTLRADDSLWVEDEPENEVEA
jgi:hypothetical protein